VTRPRDRKRKLVQRAKWIDGINRCHRLQTFGYQRVPNDDLLLRGSRGKKWIDNDSTVLRRVTVDRLVADGNRLYSGEEVDRRRIARRHNNEVFGDGCCL